MPDRSEQADDHNIVVRRKPQRTRMEEVIITIPTLVNPNVTTSFSGLLDGALRIAVEALRVEEARPPPSARRDACSPKCASGGEGLRDRRGWRR